MFQLVRPSFLALHTLCSLFLFCSSFLFSYLANQCWNGGYIYLIMLRRIKRKAPLPPCNGSIGCSEIPIEHCGSVRSEPAVGSPTQNGKRTRKFGVISRSSFTRDSKESNDIRDHKHENGYSSMETEATPTEASSPLGTPTEECPSAGHSVAITNIISSATLPSRSNSRLSESFKSQTGRNEPSSQVTRSQICLTQSKYMYNNIIYAYIKCIQLTDPGRQTFCSLFIAEYILKYTVFHRHLNYWHKPVYGWCYGWTCKIDITNVVMQ